MGELIIKEIPYDVAKDITIKNHYSKKWNTAFGKYNFGIFKDDELLGVAVYGNLMNPNSYKNWSDFVEKGQVIELNRMWIDDKLGHNAETILIGATFKYFKMVYPEIKIIQTFADGRLGCGTIYKASSFNYYGYRKTLFFEDVENGSVYHKVPMENSGRPKGFLELNRLFLDGRLKPFHVKTYRYGFILDKRLRKKINLQEEPYPEYDKGIEYVDDYVHPKGLLARTWLYFDEINDTTYKFKAERYYKEHYDDFFQELENQKENKSYLWFKEECESGTRKSIELDESTEIQISIFDFI